MIGDDYKALVVQAVLGPDHSGLFPPTLHGAWLDGSLNVLAMTGVVHPQSDFGAHADGVTNVAFVDGGLCPATVPTYFGLFDAASGGDLVIYGAVTFSATPDEDEALSCEPGGIVFPFEEPA